MQAIIKNESSDICNNITLGEFCKVRGKSGEFGATQHTEDTWKWHSIKILGYVAPQTFINEKYVTASIIQMYIDQGKTPAQILLIWNAGIGTKKCSKGVNAHGVEYDSCSYVENGLSYLSNAKIKLQ